MDIFSRRHTNDQPITTGITGLSDLTRFRVLHTLNGLSENIAFGPPWFNQVIEEVYQNVLEEYGEFACPVVTLAFGPDKAATAIRHFGACESDHALDFLEMLFKKFHDIAWTTAGNKGVEAVNQIFVEDGVGYRFTSFVETSYEVGEIEQVGVGPPHGTRIRIQYPEAIRKEDDYASSIIDDVLIVLSDERFERASEEFRKALTRYRHEDWTGAMTNCGSATESALKAVCDIKGWAYGDNDATNALLQICQENGLFLLPIYRNIIQDGMTLRNRLSDAHGRHGQNSLVERKHVRHLLNLTAANIILLSEL